MPSSKPKPFIFEDPNRVAHYDSFLQAFKTRPFIVLIYATWCGHCRSMRTEWEAAKRSSSYDIVEMESSVFDTLKSGNDHFMNTISSEVTGYPMICKVENKKIVPFHNERSKEEFKKFMTKNGGPTALLFKKYASAK